MAKLWIQIRQAGVWAPGCPAAMLDNDQPPQSAFSPSATGWPSNGRGPFLSMSSDIHELTYWCPKTGRQRRRWKDGEGRRHDKDETRIAGVRDCRDLGICWGPVQCKGQVESWDPAMGREQAEVHVGTLALICSEFLQAWNRGGKEASICQKRFHSGTISSLRFPPGFSSVFLTQTANFSC